MTFDIFNPEVLGTPRGWNNGMLAPADGRVLFVAGQTARAGSNAELPDGFVEQFEATLANVLAVVREAGGMVSDLTGREEMLKSGDILAANDTLHRTLLAMIREASN